MNIWRSVVIYIIGIAALFAAIMLATKSDAQQRQICGSEAELLMFASESFDEFPVWIGEVSSGIKVVLALSDNGSWTIILVERGVACFFAAGSHSRFDNGV